MLRLHDTAAVTFKGVVVLAPAARFRLRNSAELDVKLAAPGAPVIAKPAGAEICTEPSDWVDASFVIVNAKEVLTPAAGLAGATATAKHLPDGGAQDVCPAAGAVSVATPSKLAASTKKETRVTMKPAFGMVTPHLYQPGDMSAPAGPRSAGDPLCIRIYPLGNIGTIMVVRSFCDQACAGTTLGADGDGRKDPNGPYQDA